MKDKTTAGILAIFLGGLGIHRFYLGHIGKGIIYLLFCWTFIPSVIALIEGIGFLTMSDDQFNGYMAERMDTQPVAVTDKATELSKYFELKEKGVISQEEFDKKKAELLK